jgi:glutamate N-acetyltransferase / amino-acid N-acetyltransferase
MSIALPRGFRFAGVYAGIKQDARKLDLALIVSDLPATAAGVYTQNLVRAAPVAFDSARTPSDDMRVVAINSGNANACTGERGERDTARMAELAAAACGARAEQALVLSTGVIGEFLPMDKIAAGITAAASRLGASDTELEAAAQAMMTTDTRPKVAGRSLSLSGGETRLIGLAKGAAMIGPRMATMLAVVLTDAALPASVAQQALSAAVEDSFNCVSIDGHMSTNDTALLLANGAAGQRPLSGGDLEQWQTALADLCGELARAIAADGEGATHLVTIDVRGCADRASAHRIAKTVAESPLVKTAIAGGDPNWGRIVSAAGYAGVPFNAARVTLRVNGTPLYMSGSPADFDEAAVSHSIRDNRDTHVELVFGEGQAAVTFWTTDLTAEYVRLNADYRT